MNKKQIKDLIKLYNLPSGSGNTQKMQKHICKILGTIGVDFFQDDMGNIYATKGISDEYPCLACHIDEVHSNRGKYKAIYQSDLDIIFGWSYKHKDFCGIGGDDKNGIFIAIEMLKNLDYCKAAFFVDEEIGCVGSRQAKIDFFSDCRFIVECDRRGNSDIITSIGMCDICSDEFINDILPIASKYGYRETSGLMTDVQELVESGVGISCINMSCGYHNPHTDNEYTSIPDLETTLDLVYEICSSLTKIYKFEHVYKSYYDYPAQNKGSYSSKLWDIYDYDYKENDNGKRFDELYEDIRNEINDIAIEIDYEDFTLYNDLLSIVYDNLIAKNLVTENEYDLYEHVFDIVYDDLSSIQKTF